MNFEQTLKAMEDGKNVRRTDWRYPECAYISLLPHNGFHYFYITGKYDSDPEIIESYAMGYYDIKSECWEVVE